MKRRPKRYLETGPEFVHLTYVSDNEVVTVKWAEVGPVTDGLVQLFWEVDEEAKRTGMCHHTLVGTTATKPVKLNIGTWKLERVR